MSTVAFGTAKAGPGHKGWGRLDVAQNGKSTTLPVVVINGARPGRHAVFLANQHGTEVNGVESLRRFCEEVDPARVSGTIFVVLSANPKAAIQGKAVWGEDDPGQDDAPYDSAYNMNFVWPGREDGLLAERAVHEIWTCAVHAPHATASLVVDVHCHDSWASTAWADDDDMVPHAVACGLDVVSHTRIHDAERAGKPAKARMCSLVCRREGIAGLSWELAGQGAMAPSSIEKGRRAVRNALIACGFLAGRMQLPESTLVIDPWRDHFAGGTYASPSFVHGKAEEDGLFVPNKDKLRQVRKGEEVGIVLDPFTGTVVQRCPAEIGGALYFVTPKAACRKDDRLFTVAFCRQLNPAEYLQRPRVRLALQPADRCG